MSRRHLLLLLLAGALAGTGSAAHAAGCDGAGSSTIIIIGPQNPPGRPCPGSAILRAGEPDPAEEQRSLKHDDPDHSAAARREARTEVPHDDAARGAEDAPSARSDPHLRPPFVRQPGRAFTTGTLPPFTTGSLAPFTTGRLAPFTTGRLAPFTTGSLGSFTTGDIGPFTTGSLAPFTTGEIGSFTSDRQRGPGPRP